MKRMWFHSLDGAPWERIDFPQGSVALLAQHGRLADGVAYDDGVGNRYYWTPDLGDPTPGAA